MYNDDAPISLKQSILEAVCYYSLFDFSLTSVELWRSLARADIGLRQVIETARSMPEIAQERGFFYLNTNMVLYDSLPHNRGNTRGATFLGAYMVGSDDTPLQQVNTRLQRYITATQLYKKLFLFLPIIHRFPYLRAIFVSGSLNLGAPREDSDIDLMIITDRNKLWTARFWLALFLKCMRMRPRVVPPLGKYRGSNAGTFCCNAWVTEAMLNIASFRKGVADMYFQQWFIRLWPLWATSRRTVQEFYAQNFGCEGDGEQYPYTVRHSRTQNVFEWIVGIIPDYWYQKLQWSIMPSLMRELALDSSDSVMITEEQAKFHLVDKRDMYNAAWRERMKAYEQNTTPHVSLF